MINWHDRKALNLCMKCNKNLITSHLKQTLIYVQGLRRCFTQNRSVSQVCELCLHEATSSRTSAFDYE